MHALRRMRTSPEAFLSSRPPSARATALSLILMAVVPCAALGCTHASAPPPATPATEVATDDEAADDVAEHDSHHHYGGLAMLVAMSLDTLGIDPGQQPAVDDVREDLYRRMGPARASEQALLQTLADGVAADLIDSARVEDALARLASTTSGLSDGVAVDLSNLHSILRPEQRAALVDKVDAHWTLWQRANGEGASGDAKRWGRLDKLTVALALTPAQVEKVRAGVDGAREGSRPMAFEEIEARIHAFEAFRGESFNPTPLASDAPSVHLASWGAARMAKFFETLSPLLSADQRAKLAGMLRDHASHTEEQRPS